jgi:hypothetical protein
MVEKLFNEAKMNVLDKGYDESIKLLEGMIGKLKS